MYIPDGWGGWTRRYPDRVLIVAILLFLIALAVGAVGVAALTGKLPRNRWAGVRTPESLRDDATFAMSNKIAAPSMLGAAALCVFGGVAALTLPTIWGVVAVVVTVVAALLTAGAGGSIAARVAEATKPEEAGCGTSCGSCSLRGMCEPTA
ncbi:SdpI/YhfL family protein [Rhodococcus sp. SMB37]|nr:SdpI/YhfL family protein [Rhodococcus sp. SMB37]